MLKKILLVLVVAIAALVVVIMTRPDSYHVERSTNVQASPETVFAEVGDLKAWSAWSPWDKRDPAMRKTFSPATTGVGANYSWEGNKQVGKGKLTVTESRANERLVSRLEFLEPFPSTADASFDLKPAEGGATRVTWSMDGKANFVTKAFSLVMDMDKMVGKDFEEGLGNLKKIAEAKAEAKKPPPPPPPAPAPAPAAAPGEPAPSAAPAATKKKR